MKNHKTISIKELKSKEEWIEAFQVMKQLRTHLDEEAYVKLVRDSVQEVGYRLVALYENEKVAAVTGFMPSITLYNGKFVWVCDLITDSSVRSKGYGAKLLGYVQDWAKENNFDAVSLSSGFQRVDAHRFYEEKMNYDKVSYVFFKKLK